MDAKLHKKLAERIEKGTLRSLSSSSGMIDFGSNDYLGLSTLVTNNEPSNSFGSTGSRLISGNRGTIEAAEEKLANFFDSESGLCFNSGYDANVGIFSSIPQRGDVILYDEHVHASVRDGIRLSNAKSYSFRHNDIADLERLLEASKESTMYIAVEALYSMGGDFCPLEDVITLTKNYSAYVILDEAHSAGVFGFNGKGFASAVSRNMDVFIRLITFGKAYGSHGAVVLCNEEVKSYLINFARSFIYTTALPEDNYARIAEIVTHQSIDLERKKLQINLVDFRSKAGSEILISASNSPIQIIRFESVDRLRHIERSLMEVGIYAKAIYPPTVSEGSECLRVCIHSKNTIHEIDQLWAVLISKG